MDSSGYTCCSILNNLPATAKDLLNRAGKQRIWLFEGEIGAGKTTLIKALCRQLGVKDLVTSPTFSLIHDYTSASCEPVYHFDFYRIHHEEEALALDCAAYFDSGSYCFIEWPSKIPNLIPPVHCQLQFVTRSDFQRLLCMKFHN